MSVIENRDILISNYTNIVLLGTLLLYGIVIIIIILFTILMCHVQNLIYYYVYDRTPLI